jgi:hypothetical protein
MKLVSREYMIDVWKDVLTKMGFVFTGNIGRLNYTGSLSPELVEFIKDKHFDPQIIEEHLKMGEGNTLDVDLSRVKELEME